MPFLGVLFSGTYGKTEGLEGRCLRDLACIHEESDWAHGPGRAVDSTRPGSLSTVLGGAVISRLHKTSLVDS
jgi:hypothetical protein